MSDDEDVKTNISDVPEQLNSWVFDEELFVTSTYLLRNTDLGVEEVQKLMLDFLEENRDDSRISATYYLMGTIENPLEEGNSESTCKKKSIICKAEELEPTKSMFLELDTCAIYSVQAKPVNDFMVLLNMNWQDEKMYLSPLKSKTLIKNPLAVKNYNRWKSLHKGDEYRLDQASKRAVFNEMMKNESKSREDKKTKAKMDSYYTKSVKTFNKSPEKRAVDKNVKITSAFTKSPTHSPPPPKRRSQKILIDVEDDEASVKSVEIQEQVKSRLRPSPPSITPLNINEDGKTTNNDDIFCTEDSRSPIKEYVSPIKKVPEAETKNSGRKATKKAPTNKPETSKKKNKKSFIESDEEKGDKMEVDEILEDNNEEEEDIPEQSITRRVMREEKVVENFEDEDGYMVTRTVPKMVETDETIVVPAKPAKKAILKNSNTSNSGASKSKTKNVPNGQMKISSFFTKK